MRVDICCGLAWGDEAKGKIVAQLAKSGRVVWYVCMGRRDKCRTYHLSIIKNIKHI